MPVTKLQELAKLGQSVWYDNIRRALLDSGEMAELILENPDGTAVSHSIEHAAVLRSDKVIMWGDPLEYVLWTPSPPVGVAPETAWAAFPTTYLDAGVVTNFEPVCSGHSFLTDGK
ncbi:MAG: hypothetical protein IH787_04000, partial [Nitrospirae bacterium]|nr:hypothetical protein [Nitrospirota bacterium]